MTEAASLLDIARAKPLRKGPPCTVAVLLSSHPKADELAILLEAARNREIRYASAAAACQEAGIALTQATIGRHVRGDCSCK